MTLATITRKALEEVQEIKASLQSRTGADPHAYPDDPVGYAEYVLGIKTLTDDQKKILKALLIPPRRVLVPSGHDTGKSFLAAVAVSWWYDSHNPGGVFTIGPRFDSLSQTIWGEVREQRFRAGLTDDFIGPQAPHMRSSPHHWARAFTAQKDASLTGRHLPWMLFLIEEACAVDPIWWTVIMTMFDASLNHAQLCIFNPTNTTSQAYQEDQRVTDVDGRVRWHRFRLDATRHPNVIAELKGDNKVIPHAVSLDTIEREIRDGCEPVTDEPRSTDFEWPPSDVTGKPGKWYRPGPVFQSRWLGVWPDAGEGVWSPALWEACQGTPPPFPLNRLPMLGCDCATGKGDDYFALHGRWGAVSVLHETSNTMDPVRIVLRIKETCARLADLFNRHQSPTMRPLQPQSVPVNIDDDGTGNAVAAFLRAEGYCVHQIGAGTKAQDEEKYPNKRSELWFRTADRARRGLVCFSHPGIDRASRARIRQQLLAPTWELDTAGRRKVEPKEKTKEKLGRSPDDADGVNLAYYELPSTGMQVIDPAEHRQQQQPRGAHHGYRVMEDRRR